MPVLDAGKSVNTFMVGLGISSAAMVGNSMGGVVAVNLAIDKPDLVTKLVTIGGVGANLLSPQPTEGLQLLQEFADDPAPAPVDSVAGHGVAQRAGRSP